MKSINILIYQLLTIVILLISWEITGYIYPSSINVLPSPSIIGEKLITLLGQSDFWIHIIVSIVRILLSLGIATLSGLFVGLIIYYTNLGRIILQPLLIITQPIPKIMLYPIFIILFGFGEIAKIFYITIGCTYVIAISVLQGAKYIEPTLLDAAKSLGASRSRIFFKVVLPATFPSLMGGLKVAVGLALILMFFAETIGTERGLGHFVMQNWSWLNTPEIFAGIVITSLIGVIFTAFIQFAERQLITWRQQ